MENIGWTAIALFMVGVIYHAGYQAARITHMEEWKAEVGKAFDDLHATLRELRREIAEAKD